MACAQRFPATPVPVLWRSCWHCKPKATPSVPGVAREPVSIPEKRRQINGASRFAGASTAAASPAKVRAMTLTRRPFVLAAAALVSAPAFVLSAAAAVYILYSLVAERWYRQVFWTYGAERVGLDLLLVAGVVAAAWLAAGRPQAATWPRPRLRAIAWVAALAGAAAAVTTEVEFWSDSDPLFPHGAFVVPFVAWALASLALRRR